MLSIKELQKLEIPQRDDAYPVSASKINANIPFPPQQLILLFSHDDWEEFIAEWAYFQKKHYKLVTRLGGANDYGVDVACFKTNKGFLGEWDNYQCKHYPSALTPNEAIPEIGKIIWHIFKKSLTTPKNYFFFSPKDCGPSLKKLLLDRSKLKQKLYDKWDDWCSNKITSTERIVLTGKFQDFVSVFDFSIFQYKSRLEVIEEHRDTPYFSGRFGGGLKDRPKSEEPPTTPVISESRYIEQLFEAYTDNKQETVDNSNFVNFPDLKRHYDRSRQTFYEAESLRAFARDSVPLGTFEKLQDQVYFGVVDTEEDEHKDALHRVKAVVKTAATLNVNANGLISVTEVKDLHGICHQLANEDRLTWRKSNE